MNFLILQHLRLEDLGYLKDLMIRDDHRMHVVELDEGEKIPNHLDSYDGMICMGGPMDTWMEAEYPWLIDEKQRIREFVVEQQKPFLGVCLGCQLLGEAVGGDIVRSTLPEIGVLDVHLSTEAKQDKLFSTFPKSVKALQWHSYEISNLENHPHVTLLASSSNTKYQAFRYRSHAYGVQFHVEIRADTVRSWGAIPEYKSALEKELGVNALTEIDNLATTNMREMNFHASLLYDGFIQLARKINNQ
ncbi:type 1 glutamine amidotransferase [Candidatus Persebacteraceae bacterium Df01]|jgi:GMP synthase-like glutamine amidotransferase|uniref:Type 1 glutamine amidotransferase n=1 Tax=Candidatus Doriopsillibacter californiensis TaxID=2970740 RepID=A0ABT7QKE0_9GAMM|nr:type 1 glutamine amidotransferase [Candidatus Persebacteraceae bacterium Df01]